MSRHFPPAVLVSFAFFMLFVQLAALYWHLYFQFWWLDIPMHMLGGLWIALFGLSIYYRSSRFEGREHSKGFILVFSVALTLSIGLFWEIYEFFVDHAVGDSGRELADTLADLVNDLIGALFGAFVFIRGGYANIHSS